MAQMLIPPTIDDIRAARENVYAAMAPSPLLKHPLLDERLGCDVWVKHENHNPTGAFKVRGGLHLVARLDEADRTRGVISATTGNHGQSIAFAATRAGVPCTMVVPVGNNPSKNALMRAFGARVIEHGRDFDESREYVEDLVAREGLRYVHSANEPDLIAGVGTYALEVFEALEDVDTVLVPVGGGSGACGLITVRDALGLKTRIIARRRRARRRRRPLVANRNARGGGVGRHARRRCRHASDLRPDVRHPPARVVGLRVAQRRGTRGRDPPGARSHAQPGRRRGGRIARRGREVRRLAARSARGLRSCRAATSTWSACAVS